MLKKYSIQLAVLFVLIFLFSGCSVYQKQSDEELSDLAVQHFKENYGIVVNVERIEDYQIGEHKYIKSVTVSYENIEYEVMIDNAKAVADNYYAVNKLNEFNEEDLSNYLSQYNKLFIQTELYYDPTDCKFYSDVVLATYDLLAKNQYSIYYEIAQKLNRMNIDKMDVVYRFPQFLTPYSAGVGYYIYVMTNLSSEELYEALDNTKSITVDEANFNEFSSYLETLGYENVKFYIDQNGGKYNLNLTCSSKSSDTDAAFDYLKTEASAIDKNYIWIEDSSIHLIVSLAGNANKTEEIKTID